MKQTSLGQKTVQPDGSTINIAAQKTQEIETDPLLTRILSSQNLEAAYDWLHKKRRTHSFNSDFYLTDDWPLEMQKLRNEVLKGQFQFAFIQEYRFDTREGETRTWAWGPKDALLLKAIASVLGPYLQKTFGLKSKHLAGHGIKKAVKELTAVRTQYSYVLKTDVESYYQSMDHEKLKSICASMIEDSIILRLLYSYIDSFVLYGGVWKSRYGKGISTGCPLAPLLGALYLHDLDRYFCDNSERKKDKFYYCRYMDDILIFAKTRPKIKQANRALNAIFDSLRVSKHPKKTYIGRMSQGFEFLGYSFTPNKKISIAKKTLKNCCKRIAELLEQLPDRKQKPARKIPSLPNVKKDTDLKNRSLGTSFNRVTDYIRNFFKWVHAGLGDIIDTQVIQSCLSTLVRIFLDECVYQFGCLNLDILRLSRCKRVRWLLQQDINPLPLMVAPRAGLPHLSSGVRSHPNGGVGGCAAPHQSGRCGSVDAGACTFIASLV